MTSRQSDPSSPARLRSADIVEGLTRVPHRAFLRAMGVDETDFGKPMIGVANGHSTITPCNSARTMSDFDGKYR